MKIPLAKFDIDERIIVMGELHTTVKRREWDETQNQWVYWFEDEYGKEWNEVERAIKPGGPPF